MHKDKISIEGGDKEMRLVWFEKQVPGPIILGYCTYTTMLEQARELDEAVAEELEEAPPTSSGAVHLCWIAGEVFNSSGDKKGQQDQYKLFCESRGLKAKKFPDTSNTRFQSYPAAAAELIMHKEIYLEYIVLEY